MKNKLEITFENFVNKYKDTSWAKDIDGKEVTITIHDVEDYLNDNNSKIIDIPVYKIKHMSVHKDKADKETLERVQKADLRYPIIISKDKSGKYNRILDGHHRLQKAINNDNKCIKARVLDLTDVPEIFKKMFK